MIYPVVLALALATASAKLFPGDHVQQKAMWESYKREHGRNYATMDEETQRFGFFLENLKVADLRNDQERKNGGTALHGVTKFSDLSQAEFQAGFLTADVTMKGKRSDAGMTGLKPPRAEAGLVDWSGVYTTPVKDQVSTCSVQLDMRKLIRSCCHQGYCGSCWAFSATEQIESDIMRTKSTTLILSPEQIVQCDTKAFGCGGGWTESAYGYVKTAGGIETDEAYPYSSYQGVTGTCKVNTKSFVAGVTGFTTIAGSDATTIEANMASYVQSTGPLSVCLDASSWNSYTGGIMTVCGNSVDHCVQAVGVDASTGGYWKVRNSWGTSWGEDGYIQLAYGKNTCDITNDPTWTTVVVN
jgi:C1A family cysteine protease